MSAAMYVMYTSETDESHVLVKDYDSMTIVLKCAPTQD